MRKKIFKHNGFSLVEMLVSIGVIAILILGLYSLIVVSLHLNEDNKNFVEATEIANQKMERIRNLPYDNIGLIAGIPPGTIEPAETISRQGTYAVNTYISFYDDPYDGEAGLPGNDDLVPTDYKIVTVKVSWTSRTGPKDVTVFSKFIPRTEETLAGYGILKLLVTNAAGQAVPGANVQIINNGIDPVINANYLSNQSGYLSLPVPASYQNYQIITSLLNYSTDQTYPISVANPEPSKVNLTVIEGEKTEESFVIDRLSVLQIRTVANALPANWQVNANVPSEAKSRARLSRDNSDNLYFVWTGASANSSLVYAQKFSSAGARLWAADKNISATLVQTNPDIATAKNGRSFIVWQDNSMTLKLITRADPETRVAQQPKEEQIHMAASPSSPKQWSDFQPVLDAREKINNWRRIFTERVASWLSVRPGGRAAEKLLSFFRAPRAKKIGPLGIKPAAAGEGQVSFVGVGPGAVTGNATNITLAVPAGAAAGDLLLAYIHHDDYSDGPMVPPAGLGWQVLDNNLRPSGPTNNDSRGGLFWKIAAAGDPANYTFTLQSGNSEQKAGQIRAYRGADTANPFNGSLAFNSSATGDLLRPAPSQNVAKNNSFLVCGWGADTSSLGDAPGGPIFPAGMNNPINNFGSYITAASADQAVSLSDSPTGQKNYDANKFVSQQSINWSLIIQPADIPDDVTVSAANSQTADLLIASNGQYLGGIFIIADNTGTRLFNAITAAETGTVDAQNHLANFSFYYDLDMSAPYDCASESYDAGVDALFGPAAAFDGPDGRARAAAGGGVEISQTKTLCLYPILDVLAGAEKNQSVEIQIDDPAVDVEISAGTVIPNSAIEIAGATILRAPARLEQAYYRWRNDDGDDAGATWSQSQNLPDEIDNTTNKRIRLAVVNAGSLASDPVNYRLEYGQKNTTCADIAVWTAVPADDSAAWKISPSSHFADGSPTANNSGLSDPGATFQAGESKDENNQTGAISLAEEEFTEVEFSLRSTALVQDAVYCFRLTNAGDTSNFVYQYYPEMRAVGDNNIYIIALDSAGNEAWSVKKINSDGGNTNQSAPVIAITENFGPATTVIAWLDERNGQLDIYAQSFDYNGNKLWPSDAIIADAVEEEYSPTVAINSADEIIFAWTTLESGLEKIYARKFGLDGASLWPNAVLIAAGASDQRVPALAPDASNGFFLAWTEDSGIAKTVKLGGFDQNGAWLWQKNASADGAGYDQYEPSLAFRGGDLYSAWTDKRQGNEDIYTQKYDANGNIQWAADQRINIHTDNSDQKQARLLVNGAAVPYAVWPDKRDGGDNVFATAFSDPGALTAVANVPLIITGTKKIGENPVIYKHVFNNSTDASGELDLAVEWDNPGYTAVIAGSPPAGNIVYTDPVQPISILPNKTYTLIIYVQ